MWHADFLVALHFPFFTVFQADCVGDPRGTVTADSEVPVAWKSF